MTEKMTIDKIPNRPEDLLNTLVLLFADLGYEVSVTLLYPDGSDEPAWRALIYKHCSEHDFVLEAWSNDPTTALIRALHSALLDYLEDGFLQQEEHKCESE